MVVPLTWCSLFLHLVVLELNDVENIIIMDFPMKYMPLFLISILFIAFLSCNTTKVMSSYTPVINNLQGNPSKLVSKSGALKINILTWAEPNNGRMLWKADVYLNDLKVNNQIFGGTWNYLNYGIGKLMLEDDKEAYLYIPVEGISRIIRKSDGEIFKLPFVDTSTSGYIGNRFKDDYLLEIHKDKLILTFLKTMASSIYEKEFKGLIQNAEFSRKNEVIIESSLYENGERTLESKTITFKDFYPI